MLVLVLGSGFALDVSDELSRLVAPLLPPEVRPARQRVEEHGHPLEMVALRGVVASAARSVEAGVIDPVAFELLSAVVESLCGRKTGPL